MTRGWRFFLLFFVGHLAVTAAYSVALRQIPADTIPMFGGLFGILMTPALRASRAGGSPSISILLSVLNSLAMAGVATLVYAVVRRLRAA